MAMEAAPGEISQVAFDAVHVVAGRARHIRAASEAPARSQERDLVAMRVRPRISSIGLRREVFIEIVSRPKSVGRHARLAHPRVTQGADVDLPLAGQARGVPDPRMAGTFAVAPPAGDAESVVAAVAPFRKAPLEPEVARVAFEAAGRDQAVEVHLAVGIARAVDPCAGRRQVGNGKLKKKVALPVKIALAAAPRPDHEIEALRARRAARVAGLVIPVFAPLHPEVRS